MLFEGQIGTTGEMTRENDPNLYILNEIEIVERIFKLAEIGVQMKRLLLDEM